jgi:NAD(P)-dependent dehydrogenase (short-subunit alcohol dehydrogenase family)
MGSLEGKTALVTGGAAGIGKAVAERFIAEGARVIIADRDALAANTLVKQHGASAIAVVMDISNEGLVEKTFAGLENMGWSPDVVVANAGVQLFGQDAMVSELEIEVWQKTLEVNLTGTFLTLKHSIRAMLKNGGGSIIVTGSPTALNGEGKDFTAYSASKAGVHGMVRAVANAYSRDNIRVNTVVPGYTETPLVAAITNDPKSHESIVGRIPVGRAGQANDVAGIMVYLASDDSAFATGAEFVVDGGMTNL